MDQNREYTVSQLHDAVAIAIGPLAPMSDPFKFNKAIGFMGKVKVGVAPYYAENYH